MKWTVGSKNGGEVFIPGGVLRCGSWHPLLGINVSSTHGLRGVSQVAFATDPNS